MGDSLAMRENIPVILVDTDGEVNRSENGDMTLFSWKGIVSPFSTRIRTTLR